MTSLCQHRIRLQSLAISPVFIFSAGRDVNLLKPGDRKECLLMNQILTDITASSRA